MIRNPTELGVRRPGTRIAERWNGMTLERDPGRIPPDMFRLLVNVDFRGSGISPRGGMAPIDAAQTGCVQGIADAGNIGGNKLYMIYQGCPGLATTGIALGTFDTDYGGEASRNIYYNAAQYGSIAYFDGYVFMGVDGFFKRLNLTQQALGGADPLTTTGTNQDTVLWTFPGGRILYMEPAFGRLYLSVIEDQTSGEGAIWYWDGLTMKRVQALGGFMTHPPQWMKFFRNEKLVLGFQASVNVLTTLTSAGVFANFAPGAGTIAVVDGVEYEDNLYVVDDAANMWKWTGSGAPTVERNIVGAAIRGIAVAYGMIWYLYKSSTNHAILGRRAKAGVFTDAVKDFTAQASANIDVTRLRFYRDELYAMTVQTSTVSGLYRSVSAANVPGTWTQIKSYPVGANIPNIQQSLVI